MACKWHFDEETGERYHVPECWGTVHNPDGPCHCPDRATDDNEALNDRLDEIERKLNRLLEAQCPSSHS